MQAQIQEATVMKSVANLGGLPGSIPVCADDIVEMHAARLLLLLSHCGFSNRIVGLTKLAKLDFFVRYPHFFFRIAKHLGKSVPVGAEHVESAMVRHHYGPWDKRYYQVLAYLEARQLISVRKKNQAFEFELTANGAEVAAMLSSQSINFEFIKQMVSVRKTLGRKDGSALKKLIYEVFDDEIKRRKLGELIV
jgi:hypothetical protein